MESEPKPVKSEIFHLPGGGDCGASIEAIAEMRAERNRGGTSVPPIEGKWAHSSVGRAPIWHVGGRGFKSHWVH